MKIKGNPSELNLSIINRQKFTLAILKEFLNKLNYLENETNFIRSKIETFYDEDSSKMVEDTLLKSYFLLSYAHFESLIKYYNRYVHEIFGIELQKKSGKKSDIQFCIDEISKCLDVNLNENLKLKRDFSRLLDYKDIRDNISHGVGFVQKSKGSHNIINKFKGELKVEMVYSIEEIIIADKKFVINLIDIIPRFFETLNDQINSIYLNKHNSSN